MPVPTPLRSPRHARRALCTALCTVLGLVGLATVPAAGAADAPQGGPLVLKAARLFDGVSGKLTEPGLLVIADGKIQGVGPGAQVPAGARVIDLGDATLLPGFIDAHVHMDGESSDNWYRDAFNELMRFPAEAALYAARNARVTLEAGFTTVRDLGSSDYVSLGLRNAIDAGAVPGPRMLVANYAVGATAGHADRDPFPPEHVPLAGPREGVCNGADECRAAVRYQIKFGANVIKFMPSGGVLSLSDPVDIPELTQEEMNAIVSEAHMWGRKVAAHCHGDRAAKMAIAAGVDSIEHGSFLQDDTLQEMKKKHVYLVPTLSAQYWVGKKAATFPPVIAEKARAASAASLRMFQHAARIGVPVALGTDAAVGPHGTNAKEFSLMVQNGFTPAQALMAGTSAAAQLLGVGDTVGTLEVGKAADVVGVRGDPTKDISSAEHPALVLRDGRVVWTVAQ